MKEMLDRVSSVAFPTAGGAVGAIAEGTQDALYCPERYLEVIVFAAIGATVGYFIKILLDRLTKGPKTTRHGKKGTA